MRILVAVDLSKASTNVLSVARTWAEISSAEVWLLHVAEPEPDFVGYEPGPQYVRDNVAREFHREHSELQRLAKGFRQSDIPTTALVIPGPTSKTILKQSDKLKVDVIILGSHGHTALYHVLMGSVSEGVLKKSTRPVLVVPTCLGASRKPLRRGTRRVA